MKTRLHTLRIMAIMFLWVSTSMDTIIAQVSLTVADTLDAITCNGNCNGSMSFTVSGGTAPYSYIWSTGGSTSASSSLCAGNYAVTIHDATYTPLAFPYTFLNTGNSHTIGVILEPNGNYTGLKNGDYIVAFYTATNGQQVCGGYVKYMGGVIAFPAWGDDDLTTVKDGFANGEAIVLKAWRCNNGDMHDLSAVYSPNFAQAGYFTQNGISAISSLSGSYIPSSSVNWPSFVNFTINSQSAITLNAVLSDYNGFNISTFGGSNGSISLNPSGGQPPYSFIWSNGSTQNLLNNLSAGQYSVTTTDANQCSVIQSFTLTQPTQPIPLSLASAVSNYNGYQISLFGASDGYIHLIVTGGNLPYSFSWSNSATTQNLDNLQAGTYSVTIYDAIGDSLLAEFLLTEPLPVSTLTVNDSLSHASCSGECDGEIDLQISGGSTFHSFLWSDGATTEDRQGLCAGNYQVTISDTVSSSSILPWTYTYTSDSHLIAIEAISGTLTINGIDIVPGDFIGVFYDLNGVAKCGGYVQYNGINTSVAAWYNDATSTVKVGFDNNELLQWKVWRHQSGQIVDMIPTYQMGIINQGTFSINGLSALASLHGSVNSSGTTQVLVYNFTISQPNVLFVMPIVVPQDTIYNQFGSISITPYGGTSPYQINWNTGDTAMILNGLSAGIYSFTISDSHLCEYQNQLTLGYSSPSPLIINDSVSPISCNGACDGSISINPTSGNPPYTIIWSNGESSQNLQGLCPGVYEVIVEDMVYSDTLSFLLAEPDSLLFDTIVTMVDPFYGNTGEIDLMVSGGTPSYQYQWSNGAVSEDLIGLSTGNYSVSVSDSNNCLFTASFVLVDLFTIDPLIVQHLSNPCSCPGSCDGSVEILCQGGYGPYQFVWSNGQTTSTMNQLCGGYYQLTVTTLDTQVVYLLEIEEPDPISFQSNIQAINPQTLQAGSINLAVSGGTPPYAYLWNDGTNLEDLNDASYGNHSVSVTDAEGCEASSTFFVDLNILPPWLPVVSNFNHQITIPFSANLSINASQIGLYDMIGVFYDDNGSWICGGYAVWQGNQCAVFASEDNYQTSVKDGFLPGEPFYWQIWDASVNQIYPVSPVYSSGFPDAGLFAVNGSSAIDTLQTIGISGTVSTATKSSLPLGMMILYQQNGSDYYPVAKSLISNGLFMIDGLSKGDYLCYAIPKPGVNYGLPAYFPNQDSWDDATVISVYGYQNHIDITIEDNQPIIPGIGDISGLIYVSDSSNYNPYIFNEDWFPGKKNNQENTARNVPVILYDAGMQAVDFQLTDGNGAFTYQNLSLGTYFIRPENAGSVTETIQIVLTEANPSSEIGFSIQSGQIIAVRDFSEAHSIFAYPNPSTGSFYLNARLDGDKIRIFDLNGRSVAYSIKQQEYTEIELVNASEGLYILQYFGQAGLQTIKLLKH